MRKKKEKNLQQNTYKTSRMYKNYTVNTYKTQTREKQRERSLRMMKTEEK